MGLFDDIFGGDAGAAQQANIAKGLGQLDLAYATKQGAGYHEKKYLEKALAAILQQYDQALATVGKSGLASKQGVLDQAQSLKGEVASGLASSGLYGSTVQGSLLKGISESTTQQLAQIDSALAAMKAQLQTGKASAVAGAYGNLAAQAGNQGSALASILGNKASFLGNVQYTGGGGLLSGLGELVGVGTGLAGLFGED